MLAAQSAHKRTHITTEQPSADFGLDATIDAMGAGEQAGTGESGGGGGGGIVSKLYFSAAFCLSFMWHEFRIKCLFYAENILRDARDR